MTDDPQRDAIQRQHLEWLLEGVEAWNARRKRSEFLPDLENLDIHEEFKRIGNLIVLDQIPLRGINLKDANLFNANLLRARLFRADLSGANLSYANLENADLREAQLRETNLKGTYLRNASAVRANFEKSNVKSPMLNTDNNPDKFVTNLSTFLNLTQRQVDSMEGDIHTVIPDYLERPPHWSDLDQAEGDEPEPLPSPPEDPFIFLSYANKAETRIEVLHKFLSQEELLPVWWDQDIQPGVPWRETIADRLDSANAVLVLWTTESVQSKNVIEEAARAQSEGKLVHVRLDDAPLPYGFAETQYVNLSGWDGTGAHPAMRNLLQALRDKLDPPTDDALTDRLHRASPIAMVADDGKLSPLDTPPHEPPAIDNPADLDERLTGLQQSITILKDKAAGRYQLPDDLHHCLDGIESALNAEPLTWYGLEDTKDSLAHCMTVHDASHAWNDVIVSDLLRVISRIAELQPLMQPRQVPPDQPDAKPPETEPVVKPAQVSELTVLAEEIAQELETADAEAALSDGAKALLHNQTDAIKDASQEFNDEKRLPRLRAALKRLAYLTESIIAGASGGVATNLLTAPDALKVLASRLKPIFDALLRFFQ